MNQNPPRLNVAAGFCFFTHPESRRHGFLISKTTFSILYSMRFPVSKRVLKITVIALAVFFAIIFFFVRFYLSPLLQEKLTNAVSQGSNGLYALEMKGLTFNLFTGTVRMKQLWLRTDTIMLSKLKQEQPGKAFFQVDLRVAALNIRHAKFFSSYYTRDVRLGEITVVNPELQLHLSRDSIVTAVPDTVQKSLLERLPSLLSPYAKSLLIESFTFENGTIDFQTNTAGIRTAHTADSIHCEFDRIYVENNPQMEKDSTFYADDIQLNFKNYKLNSSTTPYALAVGTGAMSRKAQTLILSSVSTGPTIGDEEFVSRQKWRRARLRFGVGTVEITRIDFFKMFRHGDLTMGTVNLKNGKLDIHIDKNVERVPAKRMPNEVMRALKFTLSADSILAQNIDILFTEINPVGNGAISFSNTNVKIINFSNDTSRMSDATPARMYATCSLMGKAQLDLAVSLPLLSKDFACAYNATLAPMPMAELNPIFKKDNLIIESGQFKNLSLEARVRNGFAQGTLTTEYSDLKIKLVNEEDKKKKQVKSWALNILVRGKNKNVYLTPDGRTGKMEYQRVPGDDFFRFLWRSVQSGLMGILVPGIKVPFPPD